MVLFPYKRKRLCSKKKYTKFNWSMSMFKIYKTQGKYKMISSWCDSLSFITEHR